MAIRVFKLELRFTQNITSHLNQLLNYAHLNEQTIEIA